MVLAIRRAEWEVDCLSMFERFSDVERIASGYNNLARGNVYEPGITGPRAGCMSPIGTMPRAPTGGLLIEKRV